jgi:hypothetical protein
MGNAFVHDVATVDSVSRQTRVPSAQRAATEYLARCENPLLAAHVLLINAGAQLRTVAEREITPKMRRVMGLWLFAY